MKKKIFALSIDSNIMKDMDSIATNNSRSRSNQAEIAFKEFIKKHKA
ncbi:MAG: hypothetical protein AAF620_16230 [Bacteroidota bacterium]